MVWKKPCTNIHLTADMKQGMIKVGLIDTKWGTIPVIKYKLYTFSSAMYVVPLDKYDYVDDIAESYLKIIVQGY